MAEQNWTSDCIYNRIPSEQEFLYKQLLVPSALLRWLLAYNCVPGKSIKEGNTSHWFLSISSREGAEELKTSDLFYQ